MDILKTTNLKKYYGKGDMAVKALDGVNLSVSDGEFVAIVGTSGSGKSTLLHMLGGLDRPTEGSVEVEGNNIFSLKDDSLTIFRRRKIGFIFQSYNLVPVLNVYENIVLPIELDGNKIDKSHIEIIMETLGLTEKIDSLPNQLSGGQQQRVAIARTLASKPAIILADEPTGNLDSRIVEREFILSGWWEADPAFNMASIMVVSKAYMDAHMDELDNSYKENYEMTGAINSYIMFRSSFGLKQKLERMITESGYSMDENDPNFIESNVNWSYMTSNFDLDLPTVAGISAAIALIVFTGYLIIYNIFQISVTKDIRFYGLLKTIGTTGRQIRQIIRRQALVLSVIGIPIGLIAGYFIGTIMVPMFMNNTRYASSNPILIICRRMYIKQW